MIKLERHEMPQEGVAFIVMPYGANSADGTEPVISMNCTKGSTRTPSLSAE